jgi:hypothetical protein
MLVNSAADAVAFASSQADLAAALVSWELTEDVSWGNDDGHPAEVVLRALLTRFSGRLPVFLTTDKYANEAFTNPAPPELVLTPAETYQRLIRGGTERVRLAELAGRVVATQITTTPPGIPVLMPGERVGGADDPLLRYLRVLEAFDREFPGFASETHGIHRDAQGDYWITCVKVG